MQQVGLDMTIATVLSIIGLIVTLITASYKLSSTISHATESIKALTEQVDEREDRNEDEHKELRSKVDKHEGKLADHDKRIAIIEHKEGIV